MAEIHLAEFERANRIGLDEIGVGALSSNVEDKQDSRIAIVALVLLVTVWGFGVAKDTPPKTDEPYHYWQITMFIEGDWSMCIA